MTLTIPLLSRPLIYLQRFREVGRYFDVLICKFKDSIKILSFFCVKIIVDVYRNK